MVSQGAQLDALLVEHPTLVPLIRQYRASGTNLALPPWLGTILLGLEPEAAQAPEQLVADLLARLEVPAPVPAPA